MCDDGFIWYFQSGVGGYVCLCVGVFLAGLCAVSGGFCFGLFEGVGCCGLQSVAAAARSPLDLEFGGCLCVAGLRVGSLGCAFG